MIMTVGAEEETRTPTAFRPQRPQRCVSTNSTTSAGTLGPADAPLGTAECPVPAAASPEAYLTQL